MSDAPYVDPPGDGGSEAPTRGALARLTQEESFSVAEAIGGPRGVAESALPGVVFVVVFTITKKLDVSAYAAVGLAFALAVVRLISRQTPQHAFSGFLGVAVCAFLAHRTGRAENFFLPGLFINAGFALAYLVGNLVRWPLLGVMLGPVLEEGMAWRRDPARLAAYVRAGWIWVGVFLLRLAVQVPLYQNRNLTSLGTARIAMGLPLFGLAMFFSWRILRKVPPARPEPVSPMEQPAP